MIDARDFLPVSETDLIFTPNPLSFWVEDFFIVFFERTEAMAVTLEVTNEDITAYLSGEIDHHSAVELRRRIDEAVLAGTPEWLILDFSGVTFMDSSGIGLIMGRWRLMQEQGGRLTVRGVPKTLRKVMRVSGLDKLGVLEEKEEVKQ